MTHWWGGRSVHVVPGDQLPNKWVEVAREWVRVGDPREEPTVWIRPRVSSDGRVTITGVQVEHPDGVRADDLRVPIERLEALLTPDDVAIVDRIVMSSKPPPPGRRHLRLAIPTTPKYPDGFYERVAELYRRLVAAGEQPAPRLADANGVAVTTTHRWIRECRRRGFLPPGQTGRAG